MSEAAGGASVEDFLKLDIRVARVVTAAPLAGARKPAFALRLDLGELGELGSSAQLTELYEPEELVGKLVLAVVNLPARRVAGFRSEALVLGVYCSGGRGEAGGAVSLVTPEDRGGVMPGDRLG
jgi:tRNA-binding protein